MSVAVLDSYALLAFLRGEEGEYIVLDLLERASTGGHSLHMTEVNYAEVKYMTLRKDGPLRWKEIADDFQTLPVQFHPATRTLSDAAADFKSRFKMSLADAFAAALAKALKAELVTADPEFKALEKELKIGWLFKPK